MAQPDDIAGPFRGGTAVFASEAFREKHRKDMDDMRKKLERHQEKVKRKQGVVDKIERSRVGVEGELKKVEEAEVAARVHLRLLRRMVFEDPTTIRPGQSVPVAAEVMFAEARVDDIVRKREELESRAQEVIGEEVDRGWEVWAKDIDSQTVKPSQESGLMWREEHHKASKPGEDKAERSLTNLKTAAKKMEVAEMLFEKVLGEAEAVANAHLALLRKMVAEDPTKIRPGQSIPVAAEVMFAEARRDDIVKKREDSQKIAGVICLGY
ncbi:hypothetical protein B0T16DRAFT_394814 [Cercophora newfieldiana]|uniref:Uncharacterized protein n=1 Tax=Cercophora newfieldiana TaxID=92897 RepID=A0AA39XSL4_9PEZI|nr:hypothetical protein B0T16DRAFT_394814 [Cercophora newfieldiana]